MQCCSKMHCSFSVNQYYRHRRVLSNFQVMAIVNKNTINIVLVSLILGVLLKVRQIWNDFFKITFPPKNKQTNSTSLLWYLRLVNPQVDLFLFIFWRKLKTSKSYFEINWTLTKTCSCSRLYGIYFCCLEPTYKSYQKALYSAAGFTKQWMKFWLIFVQIFRHIHDFTSEKRWKQAA